MSPHPFHRSLRGQLVAPIVVLGIIISAGGSGLVHHKLTAHFEGLAIARGEVLAHAVSNAVEVHAGADSLQRFVRSLVAERDVRQIVVAEGPGGEIVASTQPALLGRSVSDALAMEDVPRLMEAIGGAGPWSRLNRTTRQYELALPLEHAHGSEAKHARDRGAVWVQLDAGPALARVEEAASTAAALLCLGVLLIAAASLLLANKIVVHPAMAIAAAIRQRGRGEDSIAPTGGAGELAEIGEAYNRLIDDLDHRGQDLRKSYGETIEALQALALRERNLKDRNIELGNALDLAEQATEAKARFLATMSHEIRTPMNCILGMAEMLMRQELNNDAAGLARTIHNSGVVLLKILNDTIDFAAIEGKRLQVERRWFSPTRVASEVIDAMATHARARNNEILFVAAGDRDCDGDETRFRQILTHLIGNAIKFTKNGHIRVEVAFERRERGTHMVVRVEDDGVGIEPTLLPTVFQPFQQGDSSTTRCFGGIGLGLSVSRELIRLMDGDIGVTSVPGEGSRFWISLPPTRVGPRKTRSGKRLISRSALCCGATGAEHRRIAEALRERGWRVAVADDDDAHAILARAAASGSTPDILVIDETFAAPDQILHRLGVQTERAQGARRIPIVWLGIDPDSTRQCRIHGFHVLRKPTKLHELEALANRAINGEFESPRQRSPRPAPVEQRDPVGRTPHVLLVEDNLVNQKIAARMLKALGAEVDVAPNGQEAVQATDAARYDMIFMDWHMPVMDGLSATRAIRQREKDTGVERVTIVAVTASVLPGDREQCLAAGMDGFLGKPVRMDSLRETLRSLKPVAVVPHPT